MSVPLYVRFASVTRPVAKVPDRMKLRSLRSCATEFIWAALNKLFRSMVTVLRPVVKVAEAATGRPACWEPPGVANVIVEALATNEKVNTAKTVLNISPPSFSRLLTTPALRLFSKSSR